MGIVGLPSFLAEDDLRAGRLERVLPGWRLYDLTIWACLPSGKQVPASTRALLDFLIAELGGEDRDPWAIASASEQRADRHHDEAQQQAARHRQVPVAAAPAKVEVARQAPQAQVAKPVRQALEDDEGEQEDDQPAHEFSAAGMGLQSVWLRSPRAKPSGAISMPRAKPVTLKSSPISCSVSSF
jgi:hypothetical protein